MQQIRGTVQHYAWGDTEFIPRLLGIEPDGRPWAELWLGTHDRGPAFLADGRPLVDETGELPYLLKVLAADQPLSLQTHPDTAQALDGFRRGVFPDPHPKPELLCALTPFHALCGVRPVGTTVELLERLGLVELAARVGDDGPGAVIESLVTGRIDPAPVVAACRRAADSCHEARWVGLLDDMYPGDPSVAATLLLNLVVLEPGQALALGAGNLHAYLHGAGVELMGPSDNVVRAGLTSKPVDVDELLRVADLSPLEQPVLARSDRYGLPDADVSLCHIGAGARHTARGHELAIELTGACWYLAPGDEYAPASEAYVVSR
jgi:mannose-6-phosphate isomerase